MHIFETNGVPYGPRVGQMGSGNEPGNGYLYNHIMANHTCAYIKLKAL